MARTPFELAFAFFRLGLAAGETNLAASEVIARRMTRLAQGKITPGEATGMVTEKAMAFAAAMQQATVAAARGGDPLRVAEAALRPVQARTKRNVRKYRSRAKA